MAHHPTLLPPDLAIKTNLSKSSAVNFLREFTF